MSDYFKQSDNKSKKDQIKQAVDYFWELVEKKYTPSKARQQVRHKTGVIL